MLWIPNAPKGKATEIDLLISVRNSGFDGWPGKSKMGTQLVGVLPLESGETLWIVYWVIAMHSYGQIKAPFKFYKGRSKDDLNPNPTKK